MRHMKISKSKFVAGCQCPKRLYWQVHQPELAHEPDAASAAVMEQGQEVGLLARELFPGGVEVSSDEGLDQAIRTTRELVANREVPALYEATFENAGVLVRVDVLQRRRDNRWRLVEVKSSTDLKEGSFHPEDVGIQYRVLRRGGLDVASACLAHVNRNYVFEGGDIDVRKFFKVRNLTRRVIKIQHDLTFRLRAQFAVLNRPQPPAITPGRHCTDPVTCEFFERCNPPRPSDHVGYLPRIHAAAVEKLAGMGVESIRDIPDDYPLNERQRRAATCVQTGEPWFSPELRDVLARLKYPVYFADFETVNRAIPPFGGMRPYDHLPFQFSVHVQREPGAEPEHYEFLATDASDPRREFISSLCRVLGNTGSIIVYSSFELQRLSDLAAWLPEYADRITDIQGRLWDMLPVIRNHVYHPRFGGSFSLKGVLPALVPTMTYEGMIVADGTDAGLAWESLISGGLDQAERERIRQALLAYCGQDTLAMVRLVEEMRLASK